MSEQDLNNEPPYEIPSNDLSDKSPTGGGLVGGSEVKDIIDSAAGVDPSRFWIVFMIAIIIALAATVIGGGKYLMNQGEKKDTEITELRKELKECPEKALDQILRQQQTIEDIKAGTISNGTRIQQIKKEKTEEINELKKINTTLEKQIEP